MFQIFLKVSHCAIPLLIIIIIAAGVKRRVRMYEVFIQGAMEGIKTTLKLTPYILAIFVAIGIFRSSGALEILILIFSPLLKLFGIPPDLLTLGILKPLSGSASLGITAELLQKYGPDSTIGVTASIAQASSETTFYVFSLYLGSVNLKEGRHILIMGLISELTAFMLALGFGALITR